MSAHNIVQLKKLEARRGASQAGGTDRPAGEAYSIMYVETGGRSGPSRMARCIVRAG